MNILNYVFWITELFDIHADDPVWIAFKRSRRAGIICIIALFIGLALAFAFESTDDHPNVDAYTQFADQIWHYFGIGFALVALMFMVGAVYYFIRALHIYLRPEQYIE